MHRPLELQRVELLLHSHPIKWLSCLAHLFHKRGSCFAPCVQKYTMQHNVLTSKTWTSSHALPLPSCARRSCAQASQQEASKQQLPKQKAGV